MQGTSADIGAGDYQIPASIKFNSKHRTSLEKQPKYEGEARRWTLASWVKVDQSKQPVYLFGSYYTNKEFAVAIDNDRLEVTLTDSKAYYTNLDLRDPTAWFHLVIAVDSSNNAAIERTRIYINGKRIHSFATATQLSSNEMSHWNQENTTTYIGASRSDRFGDCQLADTIHIDGLCLPPQTFGKHDASNNWVPINPYDDDGNFKLPVVNDGTVWLDYLTYYNDTEANGYPVKQIFDDSITLRGGNGQASADNHFTLTPPNAWEDVDTFEIFFDHVHTQPKYRLKSGRTWGEWNDFLAAEGHVGINHGWQDCSMNVVDRNVSAVEMRPKNGETTVMYIGGFKVNGITLVNGQVDPDQLRNPNSFKSWNATSGTLLDNYGGIYDGALYTGSGGTIDGNARTLFDDDLVVNKQLEIQTNAALDTGITLTDANSNVYAFRTNNDNHKFMILNSDNSSSTKTSFTGTLAGPVTIKQASGASTISGVKLDGYVLRNNVGDNSFHLKYNETANATQLGHDAFVDSATDTNPYYSGLISDFQNRTAWKAFDGTASDSSYVAGPNYGGIGVVDFTPLGGVAYSSLEVYMHQTNSGQFDAYRVNQSGGFTDVPTSGGWGWITVAGGSSTLNTFEWRDSPNSSANGAAEGIFSALRINGSTILTNRGCNNFKVNNLHVGTDNGLTVTGTGSGFTGNSADNIFDGDTSTHTTFGSSYCTITDKTINVIEKIEVYTNSGSNNNQADYFKDGNGTEYQIYNTGSTAWHKVTNTNASNSGTSLRGKIKGPWQIKRTSGGSHLYGVKVDGVWLQDIHKTYTDSLVDSPTNYGIDTGAGAVVRGNYATLNPLGPSHGTQTFSECNLRTTATSDWCPGIATIYPRTGKWYWEAHPHHANTFIGILSFDTNTTLQNPQDSAGQITYRADGNRRTGSTNTAYGASYADGDVIGVALDLDSSPQTVTFYKNNSSQGTLNLSLGTGLENNPVKPAVIVESCSIDVNFGQRAYAYTAPAGFKSLCTQNLPDTFSGDALNNPSKYFTMKEFGGDDTTDGSKKLIVPFSPDFVWLKALNIGYDHRLYDRIRGQNSLVINKEDATLGTSAAALTTWDSSGISLEQTAEESYNNTGDSYVGFFWDAGESAATASTEGSITPTGQWVNNTAGFSITTYTGTGSAATVGHGLSTKPDVFLIKNRAVGGTHWLLYTDHIDGSLDYFFADDTDAKADSSNSLHTNTIVNVSSSASTGANNNTYIMYAWTAIPGYSAFGTYTGTGNSATGPYLNLGFKPGLLIRKKTTGIAGWPIINSITDKWNPKTKYLYTHSAGAQGTNSGGDWGDFTSNGFNVRDGGGDTNGSGETYLYMAWAEHPSKVSRAQ